jgi:hypothetical protein
MPAQSKLVILNDPNCVERYLFKSSDKIFKLMWEHFNGDPTIFVHASDETRETNITHSNDDNIDEIIKMLTAYPKVKCDFKKLSKNPNLPFAFILQWSNADWDFNAISELNQTITPEIVDAFQNLPWKKHKLINNRQFPIEHIFTNIKVDWICYDFLSRGDITLEIIFNNPFFPWICAGLPLYFPIFNWCKILMDLQEGRVHQLPVITPDIVETVRINDSNKLPLIWREICLLRLNIKQILDNPDLPWNFDALSSNSTISIDDILANPQLKWNIDELAQRPDLKCKQLLRKLQVLQELKESQVLIE